MLPLLSCSVGWLPHKPLHILPALIVVGLRWRDGRLGGRALVGDGVGLAHRWAGFHRCWVGLRVCDAGLRLRTMLLGHGALLL